MTIKQLKEAIQHLPDNMDVFLDERTTEFRYGLVNSTCVREIIFSDEVNTSESDIQAKDTVFILSEE